jgi:hypothetical protein
VSHDDLLYRLLADARPAALPRALAEQFLQSLAESSEPGDGLPFVGPAAAMRVNRYSLIMMEEERSPNTFFRPNTDKAISPTFVFLHRDGAWGTFEHSGAISEAVPALLGAADRPVIVEFVACACYR